MTTETIADLRAQILELKEENKSFRDAVQYGVDELNSIKPGNMTRQLVDVRSRLRHPLFGKPVTLEEKVQQLEEKAAETKAELEYLLYFYQACDFGPAHEDVVAMINDGFTVEHEMPVPEGY